MAIEAKYAELINADLDGEIGDAERADLARYLDTNPEAQAMRADLADLCGSLDQLEHIEPPPHLKYAILDLLRKKQWKQTPTDSRWRQIFTTPALRHAVAFAAGAVMTFALISSNKLSEQAFDDVTTLVGTISDAVPPASGQNSINLSNSQLAGIVTVHHAGSLDVIDFNLVATGAVEIVASFSERDVWFKGFAQLENDNTRILADAGQVRMHTQGRNRYALYLQHTSSHDAPVTLKFYADGNLIHEANLVISAGGEKTE